MNIHNSMEDAVTQEVNNLYESLKRDNIKWLNCDCEGCRLDTICYVLNRTQPKYYVSERGILHNALDMEDSQLKTDITKLAMEGIRLISGSARANHTVKPQENESETGKLYYNFPLIMGTIYNGDNFEPLEDVSIILKLNNEVAEMADCTWSNPAKTYRATKGSYTFWPAAIECEKEETKVFKLTLEISAKNFQSTIYAVELPLVPEKVKKSSLEATYSLKVKDIFLFDTNSENPME
ncbi:MAG: late competence development ComFB family protein [Treponema sp.]|nr:late competence development ComFB family protein [Treponema sp.]